jgi:hypothetical protein
MRADATGVASLVICQIPPEKYPNSEVTGVRGFKTGVGGSHLPPDPPRALAQLALRSSRQESGPSQSGDAAKDRFVFDPCGAL